MKIKLSTLIPDTSAGRAFPIFMQMQQQVIGAFVSTEEKKEKWRF
jgi:hypothetical protein